MRRRSLLIGAASVTALSACRERRGRVWTAQVPPAPLPHQPAPLATAPPPEALPLGDGRTPTFTPAAYAEHVAALEQRLASLGVGVLSMRVEDPFVVAGDDAPDALAVRSRVVRWASDMLEKGFFDRRPGRILDVFLFRLAASYERGVRLLTGDGPWTPFGFYSSEHGGLFMNISTGGGTLVHEIVHPYVEADFEGAPAWLNEGLGSLFEQSGERGGEIVGYTNWRLRGLQAAIVKGKVPSFRTLCSMSHRKFYDGDPDVNYGQSRYLMYYLQETGLLRSFYKSARAAKKKDATGYATLVATLGKPDMAEFQKRWTEYVLSLRFDG